MLLTKPLGLIAHEGGLRLGRATKTYEYLRDWIAEGARRRRHAPPQGRPPGDPARHEGPQRPGPKTQQVAAVAHYADGSSRDVTPICYYNSSSPDIADVDAEGYVAFKSRGEVAIIAHYLDLVANVRLTHLVEVPGLPCRLGGADRGSVIDRAVFAKLNRMRIKPVRPLHRRRVRPPGVFLDADRRAAHPRPR